jgi:hypothetical protein
MNKTNFNTASKQDLETGIHFDCYVRQFSRKKQMGPFPRTKGQSLILEKKRQSLWVTLFTKNNMNSFFRKNKKRSNKNSFLLPNDTMKNKFIIEKLA